MMNCEASTKVKSDSLMSGFDLVSAELAEVSFLALASDPASAVPVAVTVEGITPGA